ncbi:MAG: hypothetical protein E6R13_00235 [Spirochaetes bacterium]|nr:MAG: hypothetical protein E6R13_00235 [Spirochaetota bacterium]
MIKKLLYSIWTFSLQKGWNFLWSKTSVDEEAIRVAKELKARAEAAAEELVEVKDAIIEVGDQIEDVASAIKGKKTKKNGN